MQTFQSPSARLYELMPQLIQPVETSGDPYLRFLLLKDMVMLLPMTDVREAIQVPATHLTALPNMPESFIGLMNSRDLVFGVVDLPYALGFTRDIVQARQYQIIIVRTCPGRSYSDQTEEQVLGLSVPKILGITRLDPDEVEPCSEDTSKSLRNLTMGQVSKFQEPQLVMDLRAVSPHLGVT